MLYIIFLLTLALFIILGLTSAANGAGPAPLVPLQRPLKLAADPLRPAVGVLGIIGVIWGVWGVIAFFVSIELMGYAPLRTLLNLFGNLLLITVSVLAAYPSVASFFGAPASGAGKFVDWFKNTFGSMESAVGVVALVFALWKLIEFILERSRVF